MFFPSEYTQDFRKIGNNAVRNDIARFELFTDLNLFKYAFKTGNRCFAILFNGAYFLLAFMVEGDESSRLRMAN